MIRKKILKDEQLWFSAQDIEIKSENPFYSKLDALLESFDFGKKVREAFSPYYSKKTNVRPPIDPEVYVKMIMVGFFEGISSERGIASKCDDSKSIRKFLHYDLIESTPDHTTLSIIRNRVPLKVISGVFNIVLEELRRQGLLIGKNLSMDSSVMEANAALSSLKNKMTQESYSEYVKKLAEAAGVDVSNKEAVARFDKNRKDRKTSNEEWENPYDKDARIGKTKHGATDMIYKPEHVVDLDTGAIVDADILFGDNHDADGQSERIANAQIRLYDISDKPEEVEPIETLTNDKGYFTVAEITAIQSQDIETVIPDKEIKRKTDKLTDEEVIAIERAREKVKSKEGKALLRRRGMYVERSFAHVLDAGGYRRSHLRGREKNCKRYLIAVATYNLSLLMRTIFGIGTPKQWAASYIFAIKCLIIYILHLQNEFTRNIDEITMRKFNFNKFQIFDTENPFPNYFTFSTAS